MENFDALSYEEKVFTIIKNGIFLNTIDFQEQLIDLYHLKGLYVELFYHPETAKVQKISIASAERLHLYSPLDISDVNQD